MKMILRYMKDYKKESILGPLFKLLEASFELLIPLVMAAIIDTGIANGDKGYIYKMCGIMVVLGLIGMVCAITAQFFAAKAAVGFGTKLRHALFAHIQSLSYTEFDTLGTSTMITRMTGDINQVQTGVNLVLRLFLRSPFIVFGAMIMAFTIDVKSALTFVVVIPLLSIVVFGIMLITMPLFKKVQGALDKVLGITRQNLSGVRVIRAFGMQESEIESFEESNSLLNRFQIFVGRISALMNPLTYIIVNGGIVVLIWSGALRVEAGFITQGAVVALVNYMSQILVELVKLANLIITITKSFACAHRIEAVFDMKSSIEVKKNLFLATEQTDCKICFENVNMRYKNAAEDSLENINFCIKKGETIGIIGGTGSGKTSLVNLIPRFYDVSSGRVLVDGIDVRDYELNVLRDKVGVVLQKAVLFKGTLRDNLRWGNENATEEEMIRALELAQAKEFTDKWEEGFDKEIAQGGKNLSGGQRQRLTIARALVRDPEILILDDSASALDYATDAKLRAAIKSIQAEDKTVIIVSQRTASIMEADKIVVLEEGSIAGIGTHEELLKTCEIYKEIYDSQFRGGQSEVKSNE
ncbi:MAG: ABC transporter ATP-binding protein [Lachnospiraceae bacterium]|nr:ABC transporter ATP-binding protein [Lachnospiraceae bacterium]